MLQVTPARTFNAVPAGLRWIPLDGATGAALWATGLQKGHLHDEDGAEVVCVDMVFKAGSQPTPRYIKRWMGPNGKWRYAYAAHEGGGVHNAQHFGEGARFKHGEGHYEVGKDGTATHSHTGHKVNVADLSAHLHEHHKADIDAHRKKVLTNLIGQIGEAATAKHKAALEKKAAAYGYEKPKAAEKKPAKTGNAANDNKASGYTPAEKLAKERLEHPDPDVRRHWHSVAGDDHATETKHIDSEIARSKEWVDHAKKSGNDGAARVHMDAIAEHQKMRDFFDGVKSLKERGEMPGPDGKAPAKPSRGAMVATPDGKMEPKKAGLSDDEHADTYDEMVRLRNELSPGGLNTGPKGAQRSAIEAKLNVARAKLGLKPHTDDPMKSDPGEAGARQRAMGIRERQRQARMSAKEASAKKEAPTDDGLDWSGGAAGIPMSPARSPEPEKKAEAKAPENLPDRLEHTAPTKSHIRHVEWTADNPKSNKGTLRVHFKDGHVHDHFDRHRDIFHKLATAESVGKAYNEHVKGIGESKTVRRAEGDIKKEARETARQSAKETKTAQVKETVRKYEERRGGGEPQGVTTPKPEAPARESEPSPRRDHYEAAQKTYGLSDRDMQLIKRRADGAVSQHVKLGDHDKAQAAIKDAVHRHVFQDRNMSPSQATKWMKERESKAVTPVPAKEAPQPAAAKAPEPKAEAAAKPATAAKAPAVSQDERDAQNAKHRANVQATKKYLDGAIKRAKTKPSGEKDRDVARARASYERASKEWNDWQEGIPEPSGEDDRTGPLDNKDNHSTVKSYRKDEPGVKEPKVGRTVVHANDDEHLVHEDDMSSSNITTGRLARSEIIGVDKDRRKVKLRSEDGTEHEVDDHHLSRGVIEKSPADIESEEKQGRLFKGLSAILKALATPWVEIPEDLALSLVAKGKSHKYIKKVATGKTSKTGKPVYRYYYKVAADTHAAKHFHAGSAFADGKHGGHWHIHAKDGDKLHLKHDETGEDRHMTTGELSAMLHSTHNVGAVEEAQRAKAKAEVAAAKESGSAKHVEAAKKRAEAVGVKEQAPEPAQTESVASEPVTTRHAFMDDPGDDKHAPGSIYRNGKGGKVYVSLAMKSRKGNRSDEDHGNYVPSGKVENTVTAREATPEEVARYEEWAAGPAGRAPRPKANIHAPQATPSTANIAAHMPAIKALRDQIVAINTMPQFSMERADANHAITAAAKALAEEMGNTPEAAHVAATVDALKSHISGTTNADVSRLDAILAGRAPDAPVPAQEPESPHGKQVQSASEASKVVLSGKTFEAKDEIRKMGGRWDAANKVWVLPVKDTMRGRADLSADLHHLRKRGVSHTFHKGRSLDAFIAALARTH